MHVLKLIRLPNLLLLSLIQVLAGVRIGLDVLPDLLCVAGMTSMATAAGYVINDLKDRHSDAINSKDNIFVSGHMTPGEGQRTYRILLVIGGLCALVLSWLWTPHFLWIYALISLLLWWYAIRLKGTPLAGNLLVSVLCATALIILWLPRSIDQPVPEILVQLTLFAFAVTFVRELVKDIEDVRGDAEAGYRTFAMTRSGVPARVLAVLITCATLIGFVSLSIWENGFRTLALGSLTFAGLLAAGVLIVWYRGNPRIYHRISLLLKVTMLTGALCLTL
jgi:4-hydroxybenzoate polyprenyltransferase